MRRDSVSDLNAFLAVARERPGLFSRFEAGSVTASLAPSPTVATVADALLFFLA